MIELYQRISESEWRWRDGELNRSVGLFASTQRLIWSSWVQASEGVVFEDGVAQTYEGFLAVGVPNGIAAPDAMLVDIKRALDERGKKRLKLFCNG